MRPDRSLVLRVIEFSREREGTLAREHVCARARGVVCARRRLRARASARARRRRQMSDMWHVARGTRGTRARRSVDGDATMGLALPPDEDAEVEERAMRARVEAWDRVLRGGDRGGVAAALMEMEAAAREDEEWVAAIGAIDRAVLRLVEGDDEELAARAGATYEACAENCPWGGAFPAFGAVQSAERVVAHVGSMTRPLALRLRLCRENGLTRSVPGMIWPSCLALGRFLSRDETREWTRAFGETRGRKCLEIGGGNMIAGMTFAAHNYDWQVILTDRDAAAVSNAAYNVRRQQTRYLVDEYASATTARILDWDDDDEFFEQHGNSFDIILGADVVHMQHMAPGVVRALRRYLAPGGYALIVNPIPASRGGAETFRTLLDEESWSVVRHPVTSPIICVGMEEECEDVPLELYAISHADGDMQAPPLHVL